MTNLPGLLLKECINKFKDEIIDKDTIIKFENGVTSKISHFEKSFKEEGYINSAQYAEFQKIQDALDEKVQKLEDQFDNHFKLQVDDLNNLLNSTIDRIGKIEDKSNLIMKSQIKQNTESRFTNEGRRDEYNEKFRQIQHKIKDLNGILSNMKNAPLKLSSKDKEAFLNEISPNIVKIVKVDTLRFIKSKLKESGISLNKMPTFGRKGTMNFDRKGTSFESREGRGNNDDTSSPVNPVRMATFKRVDETFKQHSSFSRRTNEDIVMNRIDNLEKLVKKISKMSQSGQIIRLEDRINRLTDEVRSSI